jgi:hypothetical protein
MRTVRKPGESPSLPQLTRRQLVDPRQRTLDEVDLGANPDPTILPEPGLQFDPVLRDPNGVPEPGGQQEVPEHPRELEGEQGSAP